MDLIGNGLLLIEPCGIEITLLKWKTTTNQKLLIEPCGIEMTTQTQTGKTKMTF